MNMDIVEFFFRHNETKSKMFCEEISADKDLNNNGKFFLEIVMDTIGGKLNYFSTF